MNLHKATSIGNHIIEALSPHCERGPVFAGSIRRNKPEVKDIELIAVPKITPVLNLFGEMQYEHATIEIASLKLGEILKAGQRYKQIALPQGINLDLFMVQEPAQWGVLYTIRTGPADFSRWTVTQQFMGGALPGASYVRDGAVRKGGTRIYDDDQEKWIWMGGEIVPMPEEIDFLEYCGLGWIEPEKREPKWRR